MRLEMVRRNKLVFTAATLIAGPLAGRSLLWTQNLELQHFGKNALPGFPPMKSRWFLMAGKPYPYGI